MSVDQNLKKKLRIALARAYKTNDSQQGNLKICEKANRIFQDFMLNNQEWSNDETGTFLITIADQYFDILKEIEKTRNTDKPKYELLCKTLNPIHFILGLYTVHDFAHFDSEDKIKILRKLKDHIFSRVEYIRSVSFIHMLLEPIVGNNDEFEDDDDDENGESDLSSDSSSSVESTDKNNETSTALIDKDNQGKEKDSDKEEDKENDKINSMLNHQLVSYAFFEINDSQYYQKVINQENLYEEKDLKKQFQNILSIYLIQEAVIGRDDDDEDQYQVFIKEFDHLTNIVDSFTNIIEKYDQLDSNTQIYVVQLAETIIYLFLDFYLNECTAETDQLENVPKTKAKKTLEIGKKLMKILQQEKYQASQYDYLQEKILTAAAKLIAYSAGYIQADKSTDYIEEIQEGLILIQKSILQILNPFIKDETKRVDINQTQKIIIYNIFDSLTQIFSIADFKTLKIILNQDTFDCLLVLCGLDQNEYDLFEKSETSNEFFQLQGGYDKKYYKEFPYAFIPEINKVKEASLQFLLFCVKTFKENKTIAKENPVAAEKAAAALMILALCEREHLTEHKAHVAGFCKNELFELIMDESTEKLIRYRAIWVIETYADFLDKCDQLAIMRYFTGLLQDKERQHSELIYVSCVMALLRYIGDYTTAIDQDKLTEAQLKEDLQIDTKALILIYIRMMNKYQELLEFQSAVGDIVLLYEKDLNFDLDLMSSLLTSIGQNFNIIVAKDFFFKKQPNNDQEVYQDYLNPIIAVLLKFIKLATQNQDKILEVQKILKQFFKHMTTAGLYLTNNKGDHILRIFYMILAKTRTTFEITEPQGADNLDSSEEETKEEEKKEEGDNNDDDNTDKQVLARILLNSTYYYNTPAKVESLLKQIKQKEEESKDKKKKKKDENDEEDNDSDQQIDTILSALEFNAFNIHFVLQQLKGEDLSTLFEDIDGISDPDEEAKQTRLRIFNMLRIFTKILQNFKTKDLQNHSAYWLLIVALIEREQIDDMDQEFIEYQQENGIDSASDPFFLFESSLNILCRYFKKLSQWYNATIFTFYFKLINLYYWYDSERTYNEISQSLFSEKPEDFKIFVRDYEVQDPLNPNLWSPESFYISHFTRGQVWILLGLQKLMQHKPAKNECKEYISQNLKALSNATKNVITKHILPLLNKEPANQLMKLDQTLTYDLLEQDLDTFNDLFLQEQAYYDDVLVVCLQMYYCSFESIIDIEETIEQIESLIITMIDLSEQSLELSMEDRQVVKKQLNEMKKELKDAQSLAKNNEDDDD